MPIRLGDFVRFRSGKAPDALKGRERDLGTVVSLVPRGGPEPWPIVQFKGYQTSELQPGLVDVIGEAAWPTRNDPKGEI